MLIAQSINIVFKNEKQKSRYLETRDHVRLLLLAMLVLTYPHMPDAFDG